MVSDKCICLFGLMQNTRRQTKEAQGEQLRWACVKLQLYGFMPSSRARFWDFRCCWPFDGREKCCELGRHGIKKITMTTKQERLSFALIHVIMKGKIEFSIFFFVRIAMGYLLALCFYTLILCHLTRKWSCVTFCFCFLNVVLVKLMK